MKPPELDDKDVFNLISAYVNKVGDQSISWLLEAVKSLALIHSAGVTGAAALLATTGSEFRTPGILALAGFSMGFIFAGLCMYVNSVMLLKIQDAVRVEVAKSNDFRRDLAKILAAPELTWVRRTSSCLGWGSMGIFIVVIAYLGFAFTR